jgi:hypothetical protein
MSTKITIQEQNLLRHHKYQVRAFNTKNYHYQDFSKRGERGRRGEKKSMEISFNKSSQNISFFRQTHTHTHSTASAKAEM